MSQQFIPDIIRCIATYLDVKDVVEYICINKNINKAVLCDLFMLPYYNLHLSGVNNRYPGDKKILQILMMKYNPDINDIQRVCRMFKAGYLIAAKNYISKLDEVTSSEQDQYSETNQIFGNTVNQILGCFFPISTKYVSGPDISRIMTKCGKNLWDIAIRHSIGNRYDDCFDYCISVKKCGHQIINFAIISKNIYATKYAYHNFSPEDFCRATYNTSIDLEDDYSTELCRLTHNYLKIYEMVYSNITNTNFLCNMIHLIVKLKLPYDVEYLTNFAAKYSSLECNKMLPEIHNFTSEQYKALFLVALKHNDISVIDFYYFKAPMQKIPKSEKPQIGEFIFLSRLGVKFSEEELPANTLKYILKNREKYTDYNIENLFLLCLATNCDMKDVIIKEDYDLILNILYNSTEVLYNIAIDVLDKIEGTVIHDSILNINTLKLLIEKKKEQLVRYLIFTLSESVDDEKVITYCRKNLTFEETEYIKRLLQDREVCSITRFSALMRITFRESKCK